MKEGEFVSKVGWEEKGPFMCREPHEQKRSPSTSCIHQCQETKSVRQVQRVRGQHTGGPYDGEWSAVPCPATMEPKAKGKFSHTDLVFLLHFEILFILEFFH